MRGLIDSVYRSALSSLFPRCCAGCEAVLPDKTAGDYCAACQTELPLVVEPTCQRCGAPVALIASQDRCLHCEKHSLRFDRAIAAGVYEGLLRHQVLTAKHASGQAAAVALGRAMAEVAAQRLAGEAVDVVASIPMHWRRRVVRQHNSAESMGDIVAARLNAPFESRLLKWSRATRKQAELAITPRSNNVRGAIGVRSGYRLHDATVVVVDDILTTGATLSDAARALKQAGAARVVAVVAARSL